MKKLVLLSAIVLGGVAYNNKANAQISIHLGFNVPVRHVYVPAPEPVETVYNDYYDNSDDYYYLPDVEAYYSVPNHCYYYNDGDNWVSAAYLPGAYRNYDWRNARRFEIRGNRPYMHHDIYRSRWGGNDNGRSWGHRNDNFAGRGFDNRDGEYHRDGEYNHRDGEYNHRDGEYNHRDGGAFGQHSNQNYGQPYGGGRNNGYNGRDGWDGQSAGGNGYYQPNQNQGRNGNRNYGGGQPYQNGGGYNRGNNGNSQPANQNSGGNRGNGYTGGQVAQNAMRNNARMDASMRPARF